MANKKLNKNKMKLTYTKIKPTEPGYYWTKHTVGGEPLAQKWTMKSIEHHPATTIMWAGPIPEDQLPQDPDPFDIVWESFELNREDNRVCRVGGVWLSKDVFRAVYDAIRSVIEKEKNNYKYNYKK